MDINTNNTREKVKIHSKKISTFFISSFAQTVFQSLMSMKVAQTKLTWNNFKTSCLYSSGIIISETFLEPKKFQWITNIKSWIYNKINLQKQNYITKYQLAISLSAWLLTSAIASYAAVILDKLSNGNLETFLNLNMLKTTSTDLSLAIAISFFDSWIIEIIKENINNFKTNETLKHDDINPDIESGNTEINENNVQDKTELLDIKTKKVDYKSLLLTLPLFLSSTGFIWLNESLNNDNDLNSKILDDLPFLLLYNSGSITFSLLNCIVNDDDELPLVSLFKKCINSKTSAVTNDIKKDATQDEEITENVIKKFNSCSNLVSSSNNDSSYLNDGRCKTRSYSL